MRVLIVEDEVKLARNIASVLKEVASFAVDVSNDGEDGQHMAMTNHYDLIILDLMLPKVEGLAILAHLRSRKVLTPVLVLTAKDATSDVIRGLDLGCDDYLTKPFDMGELVARCKALIRRSHGKPSPVLTVGPLTIHALTRQVVFQGRSFFLPAMEYRLLEYLAMRAGEVVSQTDLLEHLYDFNSERFSNVIEVYISALRRRFDPTLPYKLIHTLKGHGYLLGEVRP
jgi:two-component system response regulator PhoP